VLKVLAVCDDVDSRLYAPGLRASVAVDLLLGCGDLPAYYLDYLVSQLDAPLYAVHGNHDVPPMLEAAKELDHCGATWIGGKTAQLRGLLLAGFDGCVRYSKYGAYESTQSEMQAAVRRMVPWLWLNRFRYGRFLDVLITHAPPAGIHDRADPAHQGFTAFRWLLETFRPRYHLHGHVHRYDRRTAGTTSLGPTEVVNVFPYRILEMPLPPRPARAQ
jgi:Icc-related predicted phosphoesterase